MFSQPFQLGRKTVRGRFLIPSGIAVPATEGNKKKVAEAKRITALLAPIEDHLDAQERVVTDEKKRAAEAAALRISTLTRCRHHPPPGRHSEPCHAVAPAPPAAVAGEIPVALDAAEAHPDDRSTTPIAQAVVLMVDLPLAVRAGGGGTASSLDRRPPAGQEISPRRECLSHAGTSKVALLVVPAAAGLQAALGCRRNACTTTGPRNWGVAGAIDAGDVPFVPRPRDCGAGGGQVTLTSCATNPQSN